MFKVVITFNDCVTEHSFDEIEEAQAFSFSAMFHGYWAELEDCKIFVLPNAILNSKIIADE